MAHMQRYELAVMQLLLPLDKVRRLAYRVLYRVGRVLGGRREQTETENIDEIQSVHASAVYRFDLAADNLAGGAHDILIHAYRTREVVRRTCGDDTNRNIQPAFLHRVDRIVQRSVAAAHDDQIECRGIRIVERIPAELDEFRLRSIAAVDEYILDGIEPLGNLGVSRPNVVED